MRQATFTIGLLCTTAHALRGLNPKYNDKYLPDENNKWRCLSNPEIELDFTQINDDICDCPDGSDEPGTAACDLTGSFYCENKGYISEIIPSFLVDDSVCDCCDGSDEQFVKCPNTCAELKEKYKTRVSTIIENWSQGFQAKQALQHNGHLEMTELKTVKRKLDRKVKRLEAELDDLVVKREELLSESVNKVDKFMEIDNLKSTIDKYFSEFRQVYDDVQYLQNLAKDLTNHYNRELDDPVVHEGLEKLTMIKRSEVLDDNKNSIIDALDRFKFNSKGLGVIHSISTLVKGAVGQYEEDLNIRLQLLGTLGKISRRYNVNFNDHAVKEMATKFKDYRSNMHDSNLLEDARRAFSNIDNIVDMVESSIESESSWWDSIIGSIKGLYSSFTSETMTLDRVQQKITEFEREKRDVQRKLDQQKWDFTDDIDAALYGDCFEKEMGQFTYRLCFGDELLQTEDNWKTSVLVGKFDRVVYDSERIPFGDDLSNLADTNNNYAMKFNHGKKCWNGPHRSATVKIQCSKEFEFIVVSEPEKCVYEIIASGPLGCNENFVYSDPFAEENVLHDEL